MTRTAILDLSIGITLLTTASIAVADVPPLPTVADRARFLEHHRTAYVPRDVAARAVHDEYDVTHYDVTLSLDIPGHVVFGTVEIIAESAVADLALADVDLFDNMTVTAVTAGGTAATYAHVDDVVSIDLDGVYQPGESFTVSVTYQGTPSFPGQPLPFRFMTHAGFPMVLSYSEPYGAPAWWACKDDPKDKATFDIHFRVDDTMVVVSNGSLTSIDDHPDATRTYHWSTAYPMSPYLFSIAVTNFQSWSEVYTALDGFTTMSVDYYAYPEDFADAQVSWSNNLDMMLYYRTIFGEYPFLNEKYAIAEFQHPGAMEHQTATSMGWGWVNGTTSNDWVVAHELSHSWVGDMITMTEWSHAWCKEGFATYCEALYFEDLFGSAYYHDYMASMNILAYAADRLYAIDPPLDSSIYYKGAWVLHMLRHVLGDTDFFDGVRAYVDDPAFRYATANTDELAGSFEAVSGQDLSWFFDEWIYSPGYPIYDVDWSASPASGTGYDITLTVDQVQTLGPVFTMPIDVVVETDLGPESFVIWNDAISQSFPLHTEGSPITVELDPDMWIIRELQTVSSPDVTVSAASALAPCRPNPFAASTWIHFRLATAEPIRIEVFSPTGRRVKRLFEGVHPAGAGRVAWRGLDDADRRVSPGVYYYRLVTPTERLTRRAVLTR